MKKVKAADVLAKAVRMTADGVTININTLNGPLFGDVNNYYNGADLMDSEGKRALYECLGDEKLALRVYDVVKKCGMKGFRECDAKFIVLKKEVENVLPAGVSVEAVMEVVMGCGEF